jgi:thioredoxin
MKMIGTPTPGRFKDLAMGCLLSMVLMTPSSLADENDVKDITDSSFAKEVMKYKGPVLVDFYATWCGPCKIMSPVIDDLSKDFKGQVKFVRMDVDQCPKTAQKYQIEVIPTFNLFKNGKIVVTKSGVMPKEDLKAKITSAL